MQSQPETPPGSNRATEVKTYDGLTAPKFRERQVLQFSTSYSNAWNGLLVLPVLENIRSRTAFSNKALNCLLTIQLTLKSHGIFTGGHYLSVYKSIVILFALYLQSFCNMEERPKDRAGKLRLIIKLVRIFRIIFSAMAIMDEEEQRCPLYPFNLPSQFGSCPVFVCKFRGENQSIPIGLEYKLRNLTTETIRQLASGSPYMFCLDIKGNLIIYDKPLTSKNIIEGLFEGQKPIKHPMLVQHNNSGGMGVLSAGDLLVLKNGASLHGFVTTRTSGHFRPSVSANLATGIALGQFLPTQRRRRLLLL